jgi:hypothetical protein
LNSQGQGVIKCLTASFVAAAFLCAALYVLGTETEVMASASLTDQKADRLDIQANEISCGEWPYYHHSCLRDLKKPDGRARKVRVISAANHRRPTFLKSLTKIALPN